MFQFGCGDRGTSALFSIISYIVTADVLHVYYAAALIFAALVFDILDGRIARWRQKSSALGRELDSLADVISFGVAPAIIGYGGGMRGLYDRYLLVYFVACGVSRLARYNVTAEELSLETGKVSYFEGTPIATSIVLVLMLVIAAWFNAIGSNMWFGEVQLRGGTLHPLTLLFGLSGSSMISRIRVPKS
ncbi:CDP-alcohol phosphatidyltransferase family protein [Paraburkholderia bryophila]|uniref:CDP-alcohol phosphatidyltransferase family protein n=1 Tax=Paraburkholderia bryophila TaxID=420952 RepID=UPI0015C71B61|nr:CDP-alcohol phosphatidyltransferase family protein [Paraburkholderia bryophila]